MLKCNVNFDLGILNRNTITGSIKLDQRENLDESSEQGVVD